MNFFQSIGNILGGLFNPKRREDEKPTPFPRQAASRPTPTPTPPEPLQRYVSGASDSASPLPQPQPQELTPAPQVPTLSGGQPTFREKLAAMTPQERNDYNQAEQARLGRSTAQANRSANFWKEVNKGTERMGNTPVVGSLAMPAAWAIQKSAERASSDQNKPQWERDLARKIAGSARNVHTQMTLGMSGDELDALPDDVRWKMKALQAGSTLLAPTDLLGVGGLLNSTLRTGLKTAAKQGLKKEAKQLLKQGGKKALVEGAIGGGAGVGLDAGIQKWLTGEVDPSSFGRSFLTGSALSTLLGGPAPTDSAAISGRVATKEGGRLAKQAIKETELTPGIHVSDPSKLRPASPKVGEPLTGIQPDWSQGDIRLDQNPTIAQLEADRRSGAGIDSSLLDADRRAAQMGPAPDTSFDTPPTSRNRASTDKAAITTPTSRLNAIQQYLDDRDVLPGQESRILDELLLEQHLGVQEGQIPQSQYDTLAKAVQDYQQQLLDEQLLNRGAINPVETQTPTEKLNQAQAERQATLAEVNNAEDLAAQQEALIAQGAMGQAPQATPIPEQTAPQSSAGTIATPEASALPDNVNTEQVSTSMADAAAQVGGRGEAVPTAPRSHDAVVRQISEDYKGLKGKYGWRGKIDVALMEASAEQVVNSFSDRDLIALANTTPARDLITNSEGMMFADRALDRLSRMEMTPETELAVTNLLDALDAYKSKSGEALRLSQQAFDKMPLPVQSNYLMKAIDKVNMDRKGVDGYVPLSSDPARASVVKAQLEHYLKNLQDSQTSASALKEQALSALKEVREGRTPDIDPRAIARELEALERTIRKQKGETVSYFNTLVPGRTLTEKTLADYPRLAMLTSPTGRANDLLTTTANTLHLLGQYGFQTPIAKAINRIKPGAVLDPSRGLSRIMSGVPKGALKTWDQFKEGAEVGDIAGAIRQQRSGRGELFGPRNTLERAVSAGVEAATHLSEGVKSQRIFAESIKEAQSLGVPKDMQTLYADLRSIVPDHQMRKNGAELHLSVNNLNQNPITTALNRIAQPFQDTPIGGVVKNQIMPFTSWLGGNIWNGITDKNVVANSIKIGNAARKGDLDGVVENIAKLGINSALTFPVAYQLAEMGVLSPTDGRGKDYEGLYIKYGDNRYAPVSILGHMAPSLVMGYGAYDATNNTAEGQDPVKQVVDSASRGLMSLLNVDNALGLNNSLKRAYDTANNKAQGATEALASLGGDITSQYIPAITSDINALLNNSSLNPTHEAAKTTATRVNPATGREVADIPQTVTNRLIDRIPGLSQSLLEREEGVAAPDIVDRLMRGNRASESYIQAQAKAKSQEAQDKDWADRGIPNFRGKAYNNGLTFNEAVQKAVESGRYDDALEGLQAKYDHDVALGKPQSSLAPQEVEIKRLEVTRDGKYGPNVIDLYKNTTQAEWRRMGDPRSEEYNPSVYELLYQYDTALAEAGVSRNASSKDKNRYTPKGISAGGGRGRGRGGASSNKMGTLNTPSAFKVGTLGVRSTGVQPVKRLGTIRPGDLIKERKITVS